MEIEATQTLHNLVGCMLRTLESAEVAVLLDIDCGGSQRIQLFCRDKASKDSRYCYVDAAIAIDDEVRCIVEVEESDVRPVALCGKVFVSTLATNFIHRKRVFPIAQRLSFVQVVDTRKHSPKLAQYGYLREGIRTALAKIRPGMEYEIFYGDCIEFSRPEARQELLDHLRLALG